MATKKSQPNLHCVMLAGGSGTRFWPLSRGARPKQLLALTGGKPLLRETWDRLSKLAPPRRLWVVAPAALADDIRKVLPRLREGHLILEPSPRDTAPAVGLACAAAARKDPEAVVGIFPTDHVFGDEDAFKACIQVAFNAAVDGALVCLGIKPDRPATGFGYLKCAAKPVRGAAVAVERFVEKPELARARRFIRSGKYLWNGGMFVWRVSRFLEELKRTAPGTYRSVQHYLAGNLAAWRQAERVSVDYAVMEKARGVKVVPLDAGWDDVGSWDAAGRLREDAGVSGALQILVDSPGSVVFGGDRMIALVDVPGIAVIDTPDALLVVSRDGSEKVRKVVEELKARNRQDLL